MNKKTHIHIYTY